MFGNRRLIMGVALLGLGIGAVTFLGAARLTNSGSEGSDSASKVTVRDSSKGVVCLGIAELDSKEIYVYPDCFPSNQFPIRIVEIKKKEGEKVAPGDVIAILDDRIPKLNVEKAEAGLAASNAKLAQAKQAVQAHQVASEVQKDTIAAKEFEISSAIFKSLEAKKAADKNLPSAKEQYDAAQEGIKALQQALEAEKKRLKGLEQIQPTTKLDEARAGVDASQKDVDLAKTYLSMVVYKSPVEGTIKKSHLFEGMILVPQLQTHPVVVQPSGKLVIRGQVHQEYAHRVAVGQKATLHDYANPTLTWYGKVSHIADRFEVKRSSGGPGGIELFSSNDDPTLEVTIELESDAKAPVIRQGQKVRISIGTE